ncbi:hypothetical protein ACQJBY_014838 [Aegilops geniculata]
METTGGARNWSELPEDVLLTTMSAMEALDVVRASAVCSSWSSTYATFRRLRLPSPKQSPCLLYPHDDACGPDGMALYSPSADATSRIRLPRDAVVLAGSAYGWLFVTDQAANPYLLNPLTGARAVLPPATSFQCVVGSSLDGDGNIVYHTEDPSLASYGDDARIFSVTARVARSWMYRHVALSAGGAAPSCVVLVVHEQPMDLHFARPGDERWSSLSSVGTGFVSAVYNDKDGLFYALQCCGTVHALDLHGQASPTARALIRTRGLVAHRRSLAVTPCGDVLLVARTSCLLQRLDIYDSGNAFSVYKLDLGAKKKVKLEGIGDHALFLGNKSSAVCAPIVDCPRLRPNCAYLADFSRASIPNREREVIKKRDVAIYWDFESGVMHNICNMWPLHLLDMPDTAPAPIWLTPSPL